MSRKDELDAKLKEDVEGLAAEDFQVLQQAVQERRAREGTDQAEIARKAARMNDHEFQKFKDDCIG